ncbi:NAD(P)H-binding protein [Nocardia cyriacigeorgica]|uniref:SDR family oxidoreductase n=1 Tax=Nocardia cyriacigeorgica TaxID=135487 RepID=UPI001892F085|nr:NAD(P)H-binding protein [Nocardia cyriacigeorgica]MBF6316363.1 NAD(P)H-binding protein [Nocardia cyriacigeorgica]MBF6531148.1 NAD(P)H-binding protein [Nocardia cyriacigeorgica]
MSTVLVTGGTGKLGRAVVERLTDRGREVRVLSRTPGAGRAVGDLRTGTGLEEAVEGVDVVVHCATTYGRGDVVAARRLVDAISRTGGAPHLVNISIAGVDRIPLPYYRAKLAAEEVISGSGLPWTNLRATQFHDLLATIFDVQRWLPVTFAPAGFRFQPIDIGTVADHLAELAVHTPVGRAPDLGGPRIHSLRELAEIHRSVVQRRRPILSPRLPGKIARGYTEGWNLVPDNPRGTVTFEGFLRERTSR